MPLAHTEIEWEREKRVLGGSVLLMLAVLFSWCFLGAPWPQAEPRGAGSSASCPSPQDKGGWCGPSFLCRSSGATGTASVMYRCAVLRNCAQGCLHFCLNLLVAMQLWCITIQPPPGFPHLLQLHKQAHCFPALTQLYANTEHM